MQLPNSLEQHLAGLHSTPKLVLIRAATRMYVNSNKFLQLQIGRNGMVLDSNHIYK